MPNVGKPSKGCLNCRERKVKCDQKRPSCSQCLRIQKQCHGYRDPLNMMFKNESDIVARKARIRYQELSRARMPKLPSRHRSQPSDPESTSSSSRPSTWEFSNQQILKRSSLSNLEELTWELIPSIEDQAIGFFFSNYVIPPTIVPRGQFDYLTELLNRPQTDRVLHTSVLAAGLAGLGNATKCPQIMKKAREEYVSALSMTNKALQSAQTAKKDSTLISVLMLGMYENFTYQTKRSLMSWTKHINGATALLKLRGTDQFYDSIGVRIFQQLYGTILLVCLQNRAEIPPDVSDLWEEYTQISDYTVSGKEWTRIMVRYMRHAIDLTKDSSDSASIVATSLKLDKSLEDLKARIPDIWKYEIVPLKEPMDTVYGNFYHIYPDPWIAQMWNNLRSVRIVLHKVICEQLKRGSAQSPALFVSPEWNPQMKLSEALMMTAASDICASVPQITGQISFPDPPTSTPVSANTITLPELVDCHDPKYQLRTATKFTIPPRPTGMHHLIWPIYAAGEMEICPNDMRKWAIDRLYDLGLKLGTRQAIILAEDLKEKRTRDSVK
ncbi:hypothetical protein K469DRAFT_610743 [Zopfia rhizophila CBS 207.26]|uniref:Zn(2)-C6 fungal-type domain-containing protein n=1 Tax=Zopfia rhizophila CBS 207.26 TaxID=1314779 RepID=A0A6A6D8L0_9PEZI|nr:hypothetical protein K469DRAFT_610743 [Zopfia rhizophila CBS 207.26]